VPSDSSALEDIVLDAVGYAKCDHSVSTREQMTLNAFTYIPGKKHLLLSLARAKYIADDNPEFLSYLFSSSSNFARVAEEIVDTSEGLTAPLLVSRKSKMYVPHPEEF
jgi:hypothetical protein